MRSRSLRRSSRAGVVLDLIVGLSLLVIGAAALSWLGLNLHEILHGAGRFFGLG